MAKLGIRDDLIAGRYDGLPSGPSMVYSFETQEGIPVDSTNPLLRELSPFTLRIVPPTLVESPTTINVNLIGRANQEASDRDAATQAVRSLFGVNSVSGSDQARLATLQRIVSAGQIVSGASSLTERAVLTDTTTAADIAYQVEKMLQTPPLTLLINPSEMSTSYSTIQNYGDRGREGFIFERWGEGQPTVSFSGSTGAFISGAAAGSGQGGRTQASASISGLQAASRRDSAAWQNFMALYQFYRNNGYIYDTIGGSEAHLAVGAIAIDYDQFTYVGHMESFDFTYDEAEPHRVLWSMEFIVDLMYDVASSPVAVQPHRSPQPNPSWPARAAQSFISRPDGLTGGSVLDRAVSRASDTGPLIGVSGTDQFAQTPFDLLLPTSFTR